MGIGGLALAVIVASSLAWGAQDALRKVLASRVAPVPLTVLLVAGQLPLFAAWAVLAGATRISAGYLVPGTIAVSINLVALVMFLEAMRVSPLSLTIPLLSFTPAFSAVLSWLVLGEVPRPLQQAGIGLTVAGALVLNLGGADLRHPLGPFRALVRERGSVLMLGVALLWSLGSVVDKRALVYATQPMHAAAQCAGIPLLLSCWLAARGRLGELRGIGAVRGRYVAAVVAGALGLGLQLVAISLTLVSLVETIKRALGMVLSLVNGRLFLGEPITAGKVGGVVLLAAGISLLFA